MYFIFTMLLDALEKLLKKTYDIVLMDIQVCYSHKYIMHMSNTSYILPNLTKTYANVSTVTTDAYNGRDRVRVSLPHGRAHPQCQ